MQTAAADVSIINRRPTILHLPPQVVVDKNGEGRDRPRCLDSVPLKPGSDRQPVATPVAAEVWERAKDHKIVKQWIRLGWVSVKPADVAAPTDTPPPPDLSGYQGPAAIGLVETEESVVTLRMWDGAESRQAVKKAIVDRLKSLAAAPRK